jgi:signal transduction histidine kinase
VGRLSAVTRTRRGLLRRPILLFGLLLLGPAVGFCLLGWRSVEREADARRKDAVREASQILARRVDAVVADLEAIRRVEETRPYYEYQAEYVPPEGTATNAAVQASPLASPPADPRVLGWFQWESGAKGLPPAPEILGAATKGLDTSIATAYGTTLAAFLAETLGRNPPGSREAPVSLQVVIANEQRGQLFEELQLLQTRAKAQAQSRAPNQRAQAPEGAQAGTNDAPPPQEAQTVSPFLENYFNTPRESVPVRYTAFRYTARAAGSPGPPLVAWRVAEVPAAGGTPVLRRLLQGYALDPGRGMPAGWEKVGPAWIGREDLPDAAVRSSAVASIATALHADVSGSGAAPDPSLVLVAAADFSGADAAAADARRRFLLLVGGLVSVVAVGFVLLLRGVRKEIGLARRKEDFLAAVTHELKTPLTGIRMYAEMLHEGWNADEDAARSQARRILDETQRLGSLVDQVLDLAAVDRGVARPDLVRGDLTAAVRGAVEAMSARAHDAGVALTCETAPDLPPVPFDQRLVRPLVLNLLDNAIKYTPPGGAVTVRVADAPAGGGRGPAVLEVIDTGPGIEPAERSRVFDRFYRGAAARQQVADGTGLGLSIAQAIVARHRGTIDIGEPDGGRGCRVRVALPTI